jgi:hypothetical protein
MKYKILALCLALLGLGAILACPSVPIKPIEEMTEPDFALLKQATVLVTKLAVSEPIRAGKIEASEALVIADITESIVTDPLLAVGSRFLTDELRKCGVTNSDALDALALAELFIQARMPAAGAALPLTLRTRELVLAVAAGIRAAALTEITAEEKAEAEEALKAVQ